jgi:hypothetical protein
MGGKHSTCEGGRRIKIYCIPIAIASQRVFSYKCQGELTFAPEKKHELTSTQDLEFSKQTSKPSIDVNLCFETQICQIS